MPERKARRWRYGLEAGFARLAFALSRLLGPDRGSAFGGWLARTIGPRLALHRKAATRLRRALPELDEAAVEATLRGMWDNLGRTAAEYPHLAELSPASGTGRTIVQGGEIVEQVRDAGRGGIFFSAHLGNWELLSPTAGGRGLPLTLVYREANNPAVETLIQKARRAADPGRHLAKGSAGARHLMAALARGECLGMLMDQKLNDGIPAPFFGREAMTAPALARLALRFRCPVVPARIERLNGAHFRVTILPPLPLPESGDLQADTLALTSQVNAILEDWIRARPEQWFWVHNRWPD